MKIREHIPSSPDSYSKSANCYDRNPLDLIDEFLELLRQGDDKKNAEKKSFWTLDAALVSMPHTCTQRTFML